MALQNWRGSGVFSGITTPETEVNSMIFQFSTIRNRRISPKKKLRKKAKFRRTDHAIYGVSKLSGEFSHISINNKAFWTFCLERKDTTWLHDTAGKIEIEDGIAANYYCDFLAGVWEKTRLDQDA
jgi:hypothetical protein